MYTFRRAILTVASVLVHCSLYVGQGVPGTPCPEIFNYDANGYQVFGRLRLENDLSGVYDLNVNMSLAGTTNEKLKIERETTNEVVHSGGRIEYIVVFPQNTIPQLTLVVLNNKVYCVGPPAEGPLVTTLAVRNLVRITSVDGPPQFTQPQFSQSAQPNPEFQHLPSSQTQFSQLQSSNPQFSQSQNLRPQYSHSQSSRPQFSQSQSQSSPLVTSSQLQLGQQFPQLKLQSPQSSLSQFSEFQLLGPQLESSQIQSLGPQSSHSQSLQPQFSNSQSLGTQSSQSQFSNSPALGPQSSQSQSLDSQFSEFPEFLQSQSLGSQPSQLHSLGQSSQSQFSRPQSQSKFSGFQLQPQAPQYSQPQSQSQSSPSQSSQSQSSQSQTLGSQLLRQQNTALNDQNFLYFGAKHMECGVNFDVRPLILDGRRTKEGEFPWLVALFYFDRETYNFRCAGTLISNKHVITAAHCVKTSDVHIDREKLLLLFGRKSIKNWAVKSTFKSARKIMVHPDYVERSGDGDVAVIFTDSPVTFGALIKPICLWDEPISLASVVGERGAVAGWGRDENGKDFVHESRQIEIPIVKQETCLRSDPRFYTLTSDRTFCAGERDGRTPCTGDSGGGFVMKRNGKWKLRGVVSMALADPETLSCDGKNYVVFSDVPKYGEWLTTVLRED